MPSYYNAAALPGKRSGKLQRMSHPPARLRRAIELPTINWLDKWGGASVTSGEDNQGLKEGRGEKEDDIALTILASLQVRISVKKGRQEVFWARVLVFGLPVSPCLQRSCVCVVGSGHSRTGATGAAQGL